MGECVDERRERRVVCAQRTRLAAARATPRRPTRRRPRRGAKPGSSPRVSAAPQVPHGSAARSRPARSGLRPASRGGACVVTSDGAARRAGAGRRAPRVFGERCVCLRSRLCGRSDNALRGLGASSIASRRCVRKTCLEARAVDISSAHADPSGLNNEPPRRSTASPPTCIVQKSTAAAISTRVQTCLDCVASNMQGPMR